MYIIKKNYCETLLLWNKITCFIYLYLCHITENMSSFFYVLRILLFNCRPQATSTVHTAVTWQMWASCTATVTWFQRAARTWASCSGVWWRRPHPWCTVTPAWAWAIPCCTTPPLAPCRRYPAFPTLLLSPCRCQTRFPSAPNPTPTLHFPLPPNPCTWLRLMDSRTALLKPHPLRMRPRPHPTVPWAPRTA